MSLLSKQGKEEKQAPSRRKRSLPSVVELETRSLTAIYLKWRCRAHGSGGNEGVGCRTELLSMAFVAGAFEKLSHCFCNGKLLSAYSC